MSIFSKLRRAKQAADNQKEQKAAAAASEPAAAPYKHIPTHAASDALLGAPATWREEDKKAIQGQHQKRAQSNLSRNPSSLSNVTTLNQNRGFTSTDLTHAATDPRKQHSVEWASTTNGHRRSQLPQGGRASVANYSINSPPPPTDRPKWASNRRRSRLDAVESASEAASPTEPRYLRPYSGVGAPSKDVKFHLPSSREISPSHSSEHSSSSSRHSSSHEPGLAVRHPRAPVDGDYLGFKFETQSYFQQEKSPSRGVGEYPRLAPVPPSPEDFPFPSAGPSVQTKNDLGFPDFGRPSSEMGYSVTAH